VPARVASAAAGDPGYQKRSPHVAAYAFDHVMIPVLD
jgi:hypothetical protein